VTVAEGAARHRHRSCAGEHSLRAWLRLIDRLAADERRRRTASIPVFASWNLRARQSVEISRSPTRSDSGSTTARSPKPAIAHVSRCGACKGAHKYRREVSAWSRATSEPACARPSAVSGRSVRPVWRSRGSNSVSPWRTTTIRCEVLGWDVSTDGDSNSEPWARRTQPRASHRPRPTGARRPPR